MSAAKRRCIDPSLSRSHEAAASETVLEGKHKPSQTPTLDTVVVEDKRPVFTLGLPIAYPAAERKPPSRLGEFLEVCKWCEKKIPQDSDIFMYGCFGAFCSPKCREKQMERDDALQASRRKSGSTEGGNGP